MHILKLYVGYYNMDKIIRKQNIKSPQFFSHMKLRIPSKYVILKTSFYIFKTERQRYENRI